MTAPESIHMGLVGLGVMGRNLALNMADHGAAVVAHDPWPEARAAFATALDEAPDARVSVAETVADMVAALPRPRAVLIMVKAGDPVDAVLESLLPLLEAGDTVIDGGNAHYRDTQRRETALRGRGLAFIGLGVSGGEAGARHGPALMAGGDAAAFETCRPLLEAIAARFAGDPCCALVGGAGAGHFVKMVHNGIEYALMQAIAEAFHLMRDAGGLTHDAMATVFERWNEGELAAYLIEITAIVLRRPDDLADGPLVEAILDTAGQKGTGRWSSEAALDLGVPAPTIAEAVFARALAAGRDERLATAAVWAGTEQATAVPPAPWQPDGPEVEAVRQALLGTVMAAFDQGLALIRAGAQVNGWSTDPAVVARIWRAGCVIRAALLDDIAGALDGPDAPPSLLRAPALAARTAALMVGWRTTVARGAMAGIPLPALSSALAYVEGARREHLPANLIQAQRDVFGAHTYERRDRAGTFHTDWLRPRRFRA